MEIVLLVLLAFLVLGSLVALELRDVLSAVIAVGVVGLGLAIVFLLLGAPDIAITQVVVEVIVVTVLIRAAGRTGREEPPAQARDRRTILVGVLVLAAVLGFTVVAFQELAPFGQLTVAGAELGRASGWYLERARDLTGATNVVTAILLDFRGYDTLGEATVILAAVVGAVAVLRRPARRRPPPAPAGEPAPPPAEVHHG